jgi:hypothetical protein
MAVCCCCEADEIASAERGGGGQRVEEIEQNGARTGSRRRAHYRLPAAFCGHKKPLGLRADCYTSSLKEHGVEDLNRPLVVVGVAERLRGGAAAALHG